MKTAVVYYSMSGNVELVANKIAEQIGADVIRLVPTEKYPDKGFKKFLWGGKSALMGEKPVLEPYTFNSEEYDRVVIGTPVWAGTFTPPIRTFVEEHPELKLKRVSAFTCMIGNDSEKVFAKLADLLGVKGFEATATFTDPKKNMTQKNKDFVEAFIDGLAK